VSASPDPELLHLKTAYQEEFRLAFQAALKVLTSRERNLLRLQAVDNLSGEEISRIYRVSASTISRWLARARETLLEETRRLLTERFGLSRSQLDSLAGLVVSQLDVSLPRVLEESHG
jgi:RNA polymerase sigma-70 factor (ECF subfamily)